jgi:hypothetical protein
LMSFTLAAIWWFGLAWRCRGMSSLDALMDLTWTALQSVLGSATIFDDFLLYFIGPVLGPFQLRGPLDLQGWNFLFAVLSTGLLVGYLLFVGRLCHAESRPRSVWDYVKFTAAMLPCFLPPFIRLGIQIARMH